jgi:hypothetical protein
VEARTWSKKDVEQYFNLLCINTATIEHFIRCCGNFMLAEHMDAEPEQYDGEVLSDVANDRRRHPDQYMLPTIPAAWHIGSVDQRVETIMHLAMNTQKAVFKLVLHWAGMMDHGPTLRNRIQPLLHAVQELCLPYLPARMFKNGKFGGYVAENYRALTHLSPWLLRCLLEDRFAPKVPVLAPRNKPRAKWTIKENTEWLKVRRIKVPAPMPAVELTSFMDQYFTAVDGLPPLQPSTIPTAPQMRCLVWLLFRVFDTLFSTELEGIIAGNRFEALVVQLLDCVETIGRACHPDKKKPIWLSKYGLLGLLRCRQHFIDYTHVHSLYEGGIEGEGMVKELRPLCPDAVKSKWPLNLMNAFNRQNILATLTTDHNTSKLPTTRVRHNANCKRYSSWADVEHALHNQNPLSIIILGEVGNWTLHVLMRMYEKTYTQQITILPTAKYDDEAGYVYHSLALQSKESVYDDHQNIVTFGLLLPNLWEEEMIQYAVVDKDWRFLNLEAQWIHLG